MPHPAVKLSTVLVSVLGVVAPATGQDPHLDSSIVQGSCAACHEGHGASRSPMLPGPQVDVCLSCHGTQADVDLRVGQGTLAPAARPQLLTQVLSNAFTHPLSRDAYSRWEPNAVTCTSCHSPHRGPRDLSPSRGDSGRQRQSSLDAARLEFELCQSCHGAAGATTQDLRDVSRLTNPQNSSFHPVEAPAREASASLVPRLAGNEINCSDCHGNSDPEGPRGPHGSEYRYLLVRQYVTADGSEESEETYDLCYGCHDRKGVLDSAVFPEHRAHVVREKVSCATCHSAHGSIDHRALIRFGEETFVAGVAPSVRSGRLEFRSDMPGEGLCYVSCHGVDHSPASYGAAGVLPQALERGLEPPSVGVPARPPSRAPAPGRTAPVPRRRPLPLEP